MAPRSKIAKLPLEVRREVETLLVDGIDVRTIAEHLRKLGHDVSKSSVHRFEQGFLDRMEQLRVMREKADAIVSRVGPGLQMEEAASQLAMDLVMKFLMEAGPNAAALLAEESLVDVLQVVAKLQSSGVQRERFKADLRRKVEAAADRVEKKLGTDVPPETIKYVREELLGLAA